MATTVVSIGFVIALLGLIVVVVPRQIARLLKAQAGSALLHTVAVGVRLTLGGLLIVVAEGSRYPLALRSLGIVAIVAAVILAGLSRDRFERLIEWAVTRVHPRRLSTAFMRAPAN